LELPRLPLYSTQVEGTNINQLIQAEAPSTISDIKQYEYGDPLSKVHWKISSKYQDIYVKHYEATSEQQVYMFMETTPYPVEGLPRYEVEDQITECAVSIVFHILNRCIPTNLIIYNKKRCQLQGQDPHDTKNFYDTLATLDFNGNLSLNQI